MDNVRKKEVQPGLVVHFNQAVLEENGKITSTCPPVDPESDPRPFLCVEILPNDRSTWTPLTTERQTKGGHGGAVFARKEIFNGWKGGTLSRWTAERSYLQDGANLYQGDTAEVLKAQDERTSKNDRCRVSEDGLIAISAEIMRRKMCQETPLTSGKFAR